MIIDIMGTILIPGNQGKDCPGNGNDPAVECCCDECDYAVCCFSNQDALQHCGLCKDLSCPKAGRIRGS